MKLRDSNEWVEIPEGSTITRVADILAEAIDSKSLNSPPNLDRQKFSSALAHVAFCASGEENENNRMNFIVPGEYGELVKHILEIVVMADEADALHESINPDNGMVPEGIILSVMQNHGFVIARKGIIEE
jgi:hypothetical protein